MFTAEDEALLLGLVTRYHRLWLTNQRDKKLRDELDAAIAARKEEFTKLHTAFSIFGLDTKADGTFAKLRTDLGEDLYRGALDKALLPPAEKPTSVEIVERDSASEIDEAEEIENNPSYSVRETTLSFLKDAGSSGAKAAEIRKFVERSRNATLHEKTIGMTLYRLSIDGLARRKGHVWFYVPQNAEASNPGGDTPGLFNAVTEKE